MGTRKRFVKSKRDSLLNPQLAEVVFAEAIEGISSGFEIVATAGGISFRGKSVNFDDAISLDEFAYFVAEAFKEHRKLANGLRNNLLGQ